MFKSVDLTLENNSKHIRFSKNVKGCIVKIDNNIYIVTTHLYLPVKSVIYNDIVFKEFNYYCWNPLLIIQIDNDMVKENDYIFESFIKKKLDMETICSSDDSNCRYCDIDYFPDFNINGIVNMYYLFCNDNKVDYGEPVYIGDKLIGIKYNDIDEHSFIIPYIYIFESLNKSTNIVVFKKNIDDITKIGKNNINPNGNIFCKSTKIHMNYKTYLSLNYDKIDTYVKNNKERELEYSFYNYNYKKIDIDNDIKTIQLTPQLFSYFSFFNKDMINKIKLNMDIEYKGYKLIYNNI